MYWYFIVTNLYYKTTILNNFCVLFLSLSLSSLRDFAQAYELVKSERNIVYSQIQSYQQLSAEMREKLKVLQNEKEILHNAVDSKTK